ncbi:MAG: hypothetical protein AAB817_02595, partial [Patescibacteria group bacterium]
LSLVIGMLVVNWLFKAFFTNRSLVSLVLLSGIGVVVSQLFIAAAFSVSNWLNLSWYHWSMDWGYWSALWWQLVFMVLGQVALFLGVRTFSKRMHSVFLMTGRR